METSFSVYPNAKSPASSGHICVYLVKIVEEKMGVLYDEYESKSRGVIFLGIRDYITMHQ